MVIVSLCVMYSFTCLYNMLYRDISIYFIDITARLNCKSVASIKLTGCISLIKCVQVLVQCMQICTWITVKSNEADVYVFIETESGVKAPLTIFKLTNFTRSCIECLRYFSYMYATVRHFLDTKSQHPNYSEKIIVYFKITNLIVKYQLKM